MKELTVDRKRILNFSEKYIKNLKAKAKKRFGEVCNADKTLSKEFREYVSDPEHIQIQFRPRYGRAIELSLSSVYADYSFDYKDSYYQTTGIAGDIKVDSYGDAHLSNVHTTGEHRNYTAHRNGSTHFFSTALSQCEITLGAKDALNNLSNYTDVTDASESSIPSELFKLSSEKVTYDTINQYLSIGSLPNHVYEEMKKRAIGNTTSKPLNFGMTLTDYHIDELFITYLPHTYEFDLWVNYDGETYSLKKLSDVNQIVAKGPLSNHYEEYLDCQKETEYKFWHETKSKIRPFYLTAACISFFAALAIVLLFIISGNMKHEAFRHLYLWASIPLLLIGIVLFIASLCILHKGRSLVISNSLYTPQKLISTLQNNMDELADKQKKATVKAAKTWLCVVLVITAGIGVGIGTVWSNTYNEHFWYTPEIIATYQGVEEGTKYMLEIVSCDENGKFEAIDHSVRNGLYAKGRYEGQITSKNGSKLKATLTLKEEISNPGKGNFQESYTLTFVEGYRSIEGYIYSDTGMRSDNHIFAGSLETPELAKTYLRYSSGTVSMIEIFSCDADGRFYGTYTEVSSMGYCEKSISADILLKTSENDIYAKISSSNDLKKSKDATIDMAEPIYVSENFEKLTFGDKEFSVNSNKFVFISSANDFKKLDGRNDYVAILTNDIDFGDAEISSMRCYRSSLIGNGYAIKNFKLKSDINAYSYDNAGLFEFISSGSFVYNLKIENGVVEYSDVEEIYAGLLTANCFGSIFEVSVSGTIDLPKGEYVGGVAGAFRGEEYQNVTSNVVLLGKNSSQAFGNE